MVIGKIVRFHIISVFEHDMCQELLESVFWFNTISDSKLFSGLPWWSYIIILARLPWQKPRGVPKNVCCGRAYQRHSISGTFSCLVYWHNIPSQTKTNFHDHVLTAFCSSSCEPLRWFCSIGLSFGRWAVEAVTIQEFRQYEHYMQPRTRRIMMEVITLYSWKTPYIFGQKKSSQDWDLETSHPLCFVCVPSL